MKTCPKCKISLSQTEFYTSNKSKDGLTCYCKKCQKDSARVYRTKNIERVRENARKWISNNRERYNKHYRERRIKSENTRIAHDNRCTFYKIIKGERSGKFKLPQMGFKNRDELIDYLRSITPSGYNFDLDYGPKLCIDHIIPCVDFDQSNYEEWKKCWNKDNIQVLTRIDNCLKGRKHGNT